MKIQQLLEGIIEVPTGAVNAVTSFALSDFLSRIMARLDSLDDEGFELESIYGRMAKELQSKYGAIKLSGTANGSSGRISIPMKSLKGGYVRNKANRNKVYTLLLRTAQATSDEQSEISAEYYRKGKGRPARLVIYMPAEKVINFYASHPEYFDSLVDKLEGVIEHELTHAIQDMAMGEMNNNVDYYNADGSIDDDKYFTHPIEFDPHIKSEASDLIAFMKQLSVIGMKLDSQTLKNIIKNYVGIKVDAAPEYAQMVSQFFVSLKKNEPVKWKKAVKYFYGLILNKIKV